MLIVTVCLGLLVGVLLMFRVKHLRDFKELKDKFKVAQDYAEQTATVNRELTVANKVISAEVVALKEASAKAASSAKSSGKPSVPPQRRSDRKLN